MVTSDALAEARRRYRLHRERQIRAGTWRGLVDAEDARAHVRNMNRIWLISYEAVALAVGLNKSTVYHLMDGAPNRGLNPPAKISARASDAILAFTMDDLPDHVRINAVGSIRRLQALAAAGWPLTEIGARANADISRLSVIRSGEPPTVFVSMAQRIRCTFDELDTLNPLDYLPSRSVGYARSHATAQGWLPSKAWADAIDEPDVKPWQMVRCSHRTCIRGSKDERLLCDQHLERLKERGTLEGLRVMRNRKALIEDARFILATDPPIDPETEEIDRDRLAERLGTNWEALERTLLRAKISLDKLRESA
ncbi:hypothetical protein AB0B45_02580 [Nonomuraea sp. NPDC049152]|uniref:hypothetical protein n=1 Tax=Nonomuraea sp. NPDC049152 TaxID=3154350 RepID=UPI0033F0A5E9